MERKVSEFLGSVGRLVYEEPNYKLNGKVVPDAEVQRLIVDWIEKASAKTGQSLWLKPGDADVIKFRDAVYEAVKRK